MKRLLIATTALSLLAAPLSGAFAQSWNDRHDNRRDNSMMMQRHDNDRHDNDRYGRRDDNRYDNRDNYRHREWRRGARIERRDWERAERVNDWRRYHLSRPPRGYEWRRVDNNYVLAGVAGGLIASVILANH